MLTAKNGGILLDVKAKPGSHVEKLEWDGDVLTVRIRAKPVDGQANEALVELLSESFKVPKSSICIEKGGSGRNKRVSIAGLDTARFLERFQG